MRPSRAVCFASLLLALAAGCAGVRAQLPAAIPGATQVGPTAAELHTALASWTVSFQGLVVAACDRIRTSTRERQPRRNSLIWQIRMIPLSKQAAFRPDAQEGYVAVLAIATAQRHYLETGEGSGLFGAQQPIAVDAAREIEEGALAVGRQFLNERQLARLQQQVDELVAQNPIRGSFAADALLQGFVENTSRGMFSWVVDLPMVPFRALAGVSDTAQAVNSFNDTAKEFTQTVADLPHLTRWQLELLLYDAEELEAVDRALVAAESFASGAERISGAAETLPEELGEQLSARLAEARGTIAELDSALARAENLSGPLAHVADRVGEASAQWTALLGEMERREEGEPEGRPFDVREYTAAADRIADASRELRALVTELRGIDAGGGRALLDAAAWRAGLLILFFFVALAAYRFTTARLRR
jgi:hypothetical protein